MLKLYCYVPGTSLSQSGPCGKTQGERALSMVTQAFYPDSPKAEAGGSVRVQGQPSVYSKFQNSQLHRETLIQQQKDAIGKDVGYNSRLCSIKELPGVNH